MSSGFGNPLQHEFLHPYQKLEYFFTTTYPYTDSDYALAKPHIFNPATTIHIKKILALTITGMGYLHLAKETPFLALLSTSPFPTTFPPKLDLNFSALQMSVC
jgi:hypothetical protein